MHTKKPPRYCHHKGTGQARVRIDGRDIYLGKFGSDESKKRYGKIIAQWAAETPSIDRDGVTVDHIALAYLEHADGYYRDKDGGETRHIEVIRAALKRLVAANGPEPAHKFLPLKLKAIRTGMIDEDLSREYVNSQIAIIVRAFDWAASEEMIDATIPYGLKTVKPLKKGRSRARETDPVGPVADADVDAVLPKLPAAVRAMVELQRLTGMRPGEVMILRPCDITIRATDGLWVYRPSKHKTEHRDKERTIVIGPRGQELLRPWIADRKPEEFVFSPGRGKNRPYSRNAYRTAIRRVCTKLGVPVWSPNQLRHAHATKVRRQFGLEGAQVALGHARADVTQIYAERNMDLAAKIQAEIG